MNSPQQAPSVTRTVILHVVALAGLACGALTGAMVAREAAGVQRALDAQEAAVSPTSYDADGDGIGGEHCVLPGAVKPGQKACNV
jgi:hypothetical protein